VKRREGQEGNRRGKKEKRAANKLAPYAPSNAERKGGGGGEKKTAPRTFFWVGRGGGGLKLWRIQVGGVSDSGRGKGGGGGGKEKRGREKSEVDVVTGPGYSAERVGGEGRGGGKTKSIFVSSPGERACTVPGIICRARNGRGGTGFFSGNSNSAQEGRGKRKKASVSFLLIV